MFTDPDPEKFVLNKTVAENEVTSEEDRYRRKGRRTRKRNTVEFPTADIEVFVVVDKETVAIHGNASIEEYVLTMMNMERLIFFQTVLSLAVFTPSLPFLARVNLSWFRSFRVRFRRFCSYYPRIPVTLGA